ncbi:adhesion G-protein coupled receptor G5 [Pseudonaja textilis]|uniref:adhesion G-protein coupled receptor G5 n=1 Tax=Pseudonaja textilis TaxID=8673 RepID=UPI000EA91BEE|nr:adhesion G-protein coupled receptor G5 [Pseudonaja textilis]
MPHDAAMDPQIFLWFFACWVFVNSTSALNKETEIVPRHRIQKGGAEYIEAVMEIYEGIINSGCTSNETRNILGKLEETILKAHLLKSHLIINYPNIQTSIYRINRTEFKGLTIHSADLLEHNPSRPSRHSMYFPKALMEKAQRTPAKEMRIICIYLKDSCLFQDKQNRSLLTDDIVGASLGNVSVANLSKPVVIKFFHNHSLGNFSKTCVFWVEGTGEDNLGEWRTEGCETDASQESVVVCKCNHLTYFAVLLQLSSEPLDEKLLVPLTYLSDIGCGISASACFITIFLYLFTRKPYHDSTTKIHISLLGALFFLNTSFLISKTLVGHPWGCRILAAFLLYSLLCSLTWMAIEGFHLYLLVIKVYNSYIRRYLLKLSAVGWGFPGAIILVSFLSMQNVYGEHDVKTGSQYKNTSMCWITSPILNHITFAYVGGTVFFNLVILVIVMQKLRQLRAHPLHRPKKHTCKDVGTVLGMTFLLGTTWMLVFMSFGVFLVPQIFLFTIFNALQGAVICLWYCFLRCHSASKHSPGFSQSSAL